MLNGDDKVTKWQIDKQTPVKRGWLNASCLNFIFTVEECMEGVEFAWRCGKR